MPHASINEITVVKSVYVALSILMFVHCKEKTKLAAFSGASSILVGYWKIIYTLYRKYIFRCTFMRLQLSLVYCSCVKENQVISFFIKFSDRVAFTLELR